MTIPTDPSRFLEELSWRGLVHQKTDNWAATKAAYCGFDPTASSLHVGSLVPLVGLMHLERAGIQPIALVGGGTALIGDPSGKQHERPMVDRDLVAERSQALAAQIHRLVPSALIVDNAEWLTGLNAINFLRDVGRHFPVNTMLAKDSVQSRLATGLSYTEFSYMLLQAYDFLELHRRYGATLQIGGSDQWGNMTAGIDLIRRTSGAQADALTLPLLLKSDGTKFGKSEKGTVWLGHETSAFDFFQFWLNTTDAEAPMLLRRLTLLPREEIEHLERQTWLSPQGREAQQALAMHITTLIHGPQAARGASRAARVLFGSASPRELDPETLSFLEGQIPVTSQPSTLPLADALVALGLVRGKGDARRLSSQKAIKVNGEIAQADAPLATHSPLDGNRLLVRKGREHGIVRLA